MDKVKTTFAVLGLFCSTLCAQAFIEDLFWPELFKPLADEGALFGGYHDDDDGAAPFNDLEERILEVLRNQNGDVYYLLFEGQSELHEQAGIFIGEGPANDILGAMNALRSRLPDDIDSARLETMIQDAEAVIGFAAKMPVAMDYDDDDGVPVDAFSLEDMAAMAETSLADITGLAGLFENRVLGVLCFEGDWGDAFDLFYWSFDRRNHNNNNNIKEDTINRLELVLILRAFREHIYDLNDPVILDLRLGLLSQFLFMLYFHSKLWDSDHDPDSYGVYLAEMKALLDTVPQRLFSEDVDWKLFRDELLGS